MLGKSFTDEEFDELCFDFGIELDEVETEAPAAAGGKVKTMYAIALPANRPDLLCIEGLGRSLKIFMEKMEPPVSGKEEKEDRAGGRQKGPWRRACTQMLH